MIDSVRHVARFHRALAPMLVAVTACTAPDDELEYSDATSAISVSGTCTTSTVRGLSVQIAQEVDCMFPSSLVRLDPGLGVRFTSNAVLPYMHGGARTDLLKVAAKGRIWINSGYRTVAQQYLLYRWWREGRCGIPAAAVPGRSNHESGRAVDLANWSKRVGVMANHHWSHSVPGDPVHFDHFGSPDNRGKDVRAFQRLWNRNHPEDKIAVTGLYNKATAARLRRAPATGFPTGALCGVAQKLVEVLSVDGPDRVAPGARAHYAITVINNDVAEWPTGTRIVVADGTASELYDAATWTSPSEVGVLQAPIAAGQTGMIDIDVVAPVVAEEVGVHSILALVTGGTHVATIDLALTVTPNGDEDQSSDGGDDPSTIDPDDELADEDGVMPETGGCRTAGGTGWLALIIPGLVLTRSCRRSSRRRRT